MYISGPWLLLSQLELCDSEYQPWKKGTVLSILICLDDWSIKILWWTYRRIIILPLLEIRKYLVCLFIFNHTSLYVCFACLSPNYNVYSFSHLEVFFFKYLNKQSKGITIFPYFYTGCIRQQLYLPSILQFTKCFSLLVKVGFSCK